MNVVTVSSSSQGNAVTGGLNAGGSKRITLATLPAGCRPSVDTHFTLNGRGGPTGNQANVIYPTGIISLYNTQATGLNWWDFSTTFLV